MLLCQLSYTALNSIKRRPNIFGVRLEKYQRSVPSPTVKNPLKMSKIKEVNSGSV
jgi:hypothetical protein